MGLFSRKKKPIAQVTTRIGTFSFVQNAYWDAQCQYTGGTFAVAALGPVLVLDWLPEVEAFLNNVDELVSKAISFAKEVDPWPDCFMAPELDQVFICPGESSGPDEEGRPLLLRLDFTVPSKESCPIDLEVFVDRGVPIRCGGEYV